MKFVIQAVVECDSLDQAQTVSAERFGYDEQYDDDRTGEPFDYRLSPLPTATIP